MKIQTKFLGEVDIEEKGIISFSEGILGFEESKEFVLLDIPENDVFKVLQDTVHDYVAFIVVNPWKFKGDYALDVPDEELQELKINKEGDIAVLSIVNLSDDFEKSTMNLLAPVIINAEERLGKQYVLNSQSFSTKEPLFAVVEKKSADS